jgi:hypothetical protein
MTRNTGRAQCAHTLDPCNKPMLSIPASFGKPLTPYPELGLLTVGGFVWKRQRRGGNRETARSVRLYSPAHGPSSR